MEVKERHSAVGGDEDALWSSIQIAEKFLVSAMYSDAASVASEVLRKLSLKSSETRQALNSAEAQDLKEVVEAAGMVLVQAINEMGRLGSLFSILDDHFGSVEFVPHYLFLPAICLQVSSQVYYSAEQALEAYVSGWANAGATYKKTAEGCPIFLPRNVYADIVEIYSIHILSRKNPQLAISWIQKADLPESTRQEISERILSANPKVESKPQSRLFHNDSKLKLVEPPSASTSSALIFWPKVLYYAFCSQVRTRVCSSIAKSIFGGTLSFFLVYAVIKQRHLFQRWLERARKSIREFSELAFGPHINPLAAVQALPNARQMS